MLQNIAKLNPYSKLLMRVVTNNTKAHYNGEETPLLSKPFILAFLYRGGYPPINYPFFRGVDSHRQNMRSSDIQKAIAKECVAIGDISKRYILSAYTSYCVALKHDGKDVPLWTSGGAVKGVHREIEKFRKNLVP